MYVIYPAEELLRIYESPLRDRIILSSVRSRFRSEPAEHVPNGNNTSGSTCERVANSVSVAAAKSNPRPPRPEVKKRSSGGESRFRVFNNTRRDNKPSSLDQPRESDRNDRAAPSNRKCAGRETAGATGSSRSNEKYSSIMQNNRNPAEEAGSVNNPLKDLTQANLNEPLKQHNGNALKLVQTGKSGMTARYQAGNYTVRVSPRENTKIAVAARRSPLTSF